MLLGQRASSGRNARTVDETERLLQAFERFFQLLQQSLFSRRHENSSIVDESALFIRAFLEPFHSLLE
jgi:hypothetical protein